MDGLEEKLNTLARQPEMAEDAAFLHGLDQDVSGIAEAQKAAKSLRDWYLGLNTTDDVQLIDLKKTALEMLRAMRSQAQEQNISLASHFCKAPALVWGRPSQMQQVFLNLILNPIQQMAEIKRSGNITIDIRRVDGSALPLQVRFIDEGPGIHRLLQEQIFDFGFTTRKNGAGLGLTISRQIAASLKGRLWVEESRLFWGATFLLELPEGEQEENHGRDHSSAAGG